MATRRGTALTLAGLALLAVSCGGGQLDKAVVSTNTKLSLDNSSGEVDFGTGIDPATNEPLFFLRAKNIRTVKNECVEVWADFTTDQPIVGHEHHDAAFWQLCGRIRADGDGSFVTDLKSQDPEVDGARAAICVYPWSLADTALSGARASLLSEGKIKCQKPNDWDLDTIDREYMVQGSVSKATQPTR